MGEFLAEANLAHALFSQDSELVDDQESGLLLERGPRYPRRLDRMASDALKSGRTLDQRLNTRFPPVAHAVAASVLRLPPGSRVRRAFVVRTARTSFEAWVRGDYDVLRVAADPKIEVHVDQTSGTDGFEVPVGFDEIYHGPDGYCEAMEVWSQSFRNWRAEVDEVIEEAADRILLIARHSGEGMTSGVELEQWGATRYKIRHGRVVRVDAVFGPNRDGVVEAIGVQG
jgi:ketosteroid isomerase-like protein